MLVRFSKMQGLGNDFVVIDCVSQNISFTANVIRQLADRRLGVGCDQVLLVEPPDDPQTDFRYRIFNPDGAEVEQCGNGARCVARFLAKQRLTHRREMTLQVASGRIVVCLGKDNLVSVNMGKPVLTPEKIPFVTERQASNATYSITVGRKSGLVSVISMGNPHAVLLTHDIENAPLAFTGEALGNSAKFPQGCNVSFMEVVACNEVRLRVFERGAGETPACGSAACAAVVAGNLLGLLDEVVNINLPGGKLCITWGGKETDDVFMSGPAVQVFDGQIRL